MDYRAPGDYDEYDICAEFDIVSSPTSAESVTDWMDITLPSGYSISSFDDTIAYMGGSLMLENEEFRNLLLSSYEVVNKCTCGGDSGDSACYGCLWNYSNQNFHNILSRKAAKQYLEKYLCDNLL